jgi:hypothetical protein
VLPSLFCDDFHVCNAQPLKKPSSDVSPEIFRSHFQKFDQNCHLQRPISFRGESGRNWISRVEIQSDQVSKDHPAEFLSQDSHFQGKSGFALRDCAL